MTILLRMDDKMNRQLTCAVSRRDSAPALAHDLVQLGFIHEVTLAHTRHTHLAAAACLHHTF